MQGRVFKSPIPILLGMVLGLAAGDSYALSLQQAEQMVVSGNRDVQAAQREIERAQAGVLQAGARPNPNLSLSVSDYPPTQRFYPSGPSQNVTTSIGIDQVFERGGKRGYRQENAQQMLTATRADFADMRRSQQLAMASAYWDLKLAQERVKLGQETVALYQESQRAIDLRQKYGDIAEADATRLKLDVLRAEADLRAAQSDLERARWMVATLAGGDARTGDWDASDSWPALQNDPAQPDYETLLSKRADVRAAAARVAAADAARSLARSLKTRDVDVGVSMTHNIDAPQNRMALSVTVPLNIGYAYEGEISRAEADYSAARDAEARVRAQAIAEINQSLTTLQQSRARVQHYREDLLPMSKRTLDAAEYAFKRGAASVLDLLDARRVYRATQLDAAAAEDDYAKNLAAYQSSIRVEDSQ